MYRWLAVLTIATDTSALADFNQIKADLQRLIPGKISLENGGKKLTLSGSLLSVDVLVAIGVDVTTANEISRAFEKTHIAKLVAEEDISGGYSLTLSFNGDWDLGSGVVFATDRLFVRITNGIFDIGIEGHVDVHGIRIAAQASLPDLIVDGWITPDPKAGQLDFSGGKTLPPGKPPGDVGPPVIKLFSARLAPRFGRFETYADLRNVLHLGKGFEVSRLQVELSYQSGLAGDAHGRAWADATLTIPRENFSDTTLQAALYADISPDNWIFEGDLIIDSGPDMGELVEALAGQSAQTLGVPPMIAECTIKGLSLRYASEGHDLTVSAALVWPQKALALTVTLHRSDGGFSVTGHLEHGGSIFDLVFSKSDSAKSSVLVGAYTSSGVDPVGLNDLIAVVSGDAKITAVPEALNVALREAILAATTPKKMFLSATIDAGFDLSALSSVPLVGGLLPDTQSIGVSLRPTLALLPSNDRWTDEEITSVRNNAPASVKIPDVVNSPLSIVVELKLGDGEFRDIGIDLPANTNAKQPKPTDTPATNSQADGLKWIEVGRSLGPLHVDRIGFAGDNSKKTVTLALNANLSIAGLTLAAEGLGMHYELESGDVSAFIRGFGVDFSRGPISFGGAFMNADGDFLGKVSVKTPTIGLTAFGGLKMLDHAPSMFLYALINYPLGGPPFFYVTGLAGGFGVHRKLSMPSLKDIPVFPLVADAISPPTKLASDPAAQLARLHDYVKPHLGEYFIAAGLKFTSFKLIDCFVLVAVELGEHFEIDVTGHADYQTPPVVPSGVPPMAKIGMEVLGRFAPDEGVVRVAARVSNGSFVYSGLCQLFGGFAFCSWFGPDKTGSGEDHTGDFILSIGGYNSAFKKPAHYPDVERVGMRFQLGTHVSISGECYLALTPSFFMAGGALHARSEVGEASAWFDMSIDLLIGWEPYFYDMQSHIGIGAKWKCFSLDASADLHIWGPDFTGRAEISWAVFSFDVEFGTSKANGPVPIDWAHFKQSFLPDDDAALITTRVVAGLVRTIDNRSVINPSEFTLALASTVPVSNVLFNAIPITIAHEDEFGIASMNLDKLDSTLEIRLEYRGSDGVYTDVDTHTLAHNGLETKPLFELKTVDKSFPPALWGTSISVEMDSNTINAMGEITLHPKRPSTHPNREGHVKTFLRTDIDYKIDFHNPSRVNPLHADWMKIDVTPTEKLTTVLGTAPTSKGAKARSALVSALGLPNGNIRPSNRYATSLRQTPLVADVALNDHSTIPS